MYGTVQKIYKRIVRNELVFLNLQYIQYKILNYRTGTVPLFQENFQTFWDFEPKEGTVLAPYQYVAHPFSQWEKTWKNKTFYMRYRYGTRYRTLYHTV